MSVRRIGQIAILLALFTATVAAMVWLTSPAHGQQPGAKIAVSGSDPMVEVSSTMKKIISTLKEHPGAVDVAWTYADPLFDYDEMARRMLNRQWDDMTLDQQVEYRALVKQFLRRVFMTKVKLYDPHQKIEFIAGRITDDLAVVHAVVWTDDGRTVDVDFKLRLSGRWRVYDIEVFNLSMLSNYRAQFQKLWRDGGWANVKKSLQEHLK